MVGSVSISSLKNRFKLIWLKNWSQTNRTEPCTLVAMGEEWSEVEEKIGRGWRWIMGRGWWEIGEPGGWEGLEKKKNKGEGHWFGWLRNIL